MHCHKTGWCAQCAHPKTRSRAHCARSTQVVGAAARTADWSRACRAHSHVVCMLGVHWSRHAQVACPRSRHHSGHSRSRPQNGVATPFLLPSPKPGLNTKTKLRPSWRLTYVATSISCRDLVSAHSGIFQVATPKIHVVTSPTASHVATSNRPSPISATSRHHFSMSRPPLLPPMSRPQVAMWIFMSRPRTSYS